MNRTVARMGRWDTRTECWLEAWREREHSKDIDIDGTVVLRCGEDELQGAYWFHPAQVRDRWRALVDMVTNLQVLLKVVYFMVSWATVSFSRRTVLHVQVDAAVPGLQDARCLTEAVSLLFNVKGSKFALWQSLVAHVGGGVALSSCVYRVTALTVLWASHHLHLCWRRPHPPGFPKARHRPALST
jgi:hypothetical protein